ncbi:hypothetical protein LZ554_004602 [Drepanopeziza brunnea f. sp. 'monogermtubi']|nr:hypothetical protein LZ554_004602 [Drepanopeziza brunnea f. sp. 'monogermtubi']
MYNIPHSYLSRPRLALHSEFTTSQRTATFQIRIPDDNGYDSPEDEDSDASDKLDDGMSPLGKELDSDAREDQKFDEDDQDPEGTIDGDDEASDEEGGDDAVDGDQSTPQYVLDVSGRGRRRSI